MSTLPPSTTRAQTGTTTRDRAIAVASAAFSERGVAATSLDELARTMGVTKQTILYHFKSKDGLVRAVLIEASETLRLELDRELVGTAQGWDRVEATVRTAFALAVRRPDLLGLLREVGRLGSPTSDFVISLLQPMIDRAAHAIDDGMEQGLFRRSDPRLLLVSAYAAVTGVVSDPEVLKAVGLELDLRVAARLRRTVLDFLKAALEVPVRH